MIRVSQARPPVSFAGSNDQLFIIVYENSINLEKPIVYFLSYAAPRSILKNHFTLTFKTISGKYYIFVQNIKWSEYVSSQEKLIFLMVCLLLNFKQIILLIDRDKYFDTTKLYHPLAVEYSDCFLYLF